MRGQPPINGTLSPSIDRIIILGQQLTALPLAIRPANDR